MYPQADTSVLSAATDTTEANGGSTQPGAATGQPQTGAEATNPTHQQAAGQANDGKQPDANSDGKPKEAEKKDGDKQEGAPESYADFAIPEGYEVPAEAMDEFKSFAKGLGLSQEKAQEALNLHLKAQDRLIEAWAKKWRDLNEKWVAEFRADPEIGGAKVQETVANAARAIFKFGGTKEQQEALREALKHTGAGNHPAVIRFFAAVGKELAEPPVVSASEPGSGQRSIAEILYPNQGKS